MLPPGAGRSLLRRFLDDGSFADVVRSDAPTPGHIEDSLVRPEDLAPVQLAAAATQDRGWVLLLALAATALTLAGGERLRRILQER